MAPGGFFFALHIRFALPLLHYQTYPQGWTDRYTEEAYALRDPILGPELRAHLLSLDLVSRG